MPVRAIVFGSLGTLTETDDLHRAAFNAAFAQSGLQWEWSKETFTDLLPTGGDVDRIIEFAVKQGETDVHPERATEISRTKTEIYLGMVSSASSVVRPGVVRLIGEVKEAGLKLGLATVSTKETIAATLQAMGGDFTDADFDIVTGRPDVDRPKPAPDTHVVALSRLKVTPSNAVVIEDSEPAVAAASIAGTVVVATPGEFTREQNFSSAHVTVSSLGDPETQAFIRGDGPRLDQGMVTLPWLQRLSAVVS